MSFIPDRMTTGQSVLFSIVVVIVVMLVLGVLLGMAACLVGVVAAGSA